MQRKHAVLSICLGMSLLLASCSQHLTKSKIAGIEKEVLGIYGQMIAAAEALDAAKMFDYILDSKETVIQSDDQIQTRQQALKSVTESFQRLASLRYEFEQKQAAVLSSTTTEITVKGKSTATTDDGRSFTTSFSQTLLFVLTDDGWRMRHAHHVIEND